MTAIQAKDPWGPRREPSLAMITCLVAKSCVEFSVVQTRFIKRHRSQAVAGRWTRAGGGDGRLGVCMPALGGGNVYGF